MKLAIIGNGLTSHAFLHGLQDKNDGKLKKIDIDIYSNPIKTKISEISGSYYTPKSTNIGYLSKWGGNIVMPKTNSPGSVFLKKFLECESKSNVGSILDACLDENQYLYANLNPVNFYSRISEIFKYQQTEIVLNYITAEVTRIKKGKGSVGIEFNGNLKNYDYLILCGGSLSTALILRNSMFLSESEIEVFDHGVDFEYEKFRFNESSIYKPFMYTPQIVTPEYDMGCFYHISSLNKESKVSDRLMANFYRIIAGRNYAELIFEDPIKLIGRLREAFFEYLHNRSPMHEVKAVITCHRSCDARIKFTNKGQYYIDWKPIVSKSLVSAFHFHGTLCKFKIPRININDRLIIADGSLLEPIDDRSIGGYLFADSYDVAQKFLNQII